MKVKEVPQDGKSWLKTTMVYYAENDEGKYEAVPSTGWDLRYYAGYNLQKEFRELTEQARERVKKNETSPLEYFMYNAYMDPDGLAQFSEIPRRKVKKHLTPKGFEKIDDATLARYAHIMHTDVETIKNFKSTL